MEIGNGLKWQIPCRIHLEKIGKKEETTFCSSSIARSVSNTEICNKFLFHGLELIHYLKSISWSLIKEAVRVFSGDCIVFDPVVVVVVVISILG